MNGIVRRIDDLGRVVIPREIRRIMGLADGDALTLTLGSDNKTLSLSAYEVRCVFCNEAINTDLNDTNLCCDCRKVLKENRKVGEKL